MDKHVSEGLGVVVLEAFNDEFDGCVFLQLSDAKVEDGQATYHVGETKSSHIKENCLGD